MSSQFIKGTMALPRRPLRYKEFTTELPSDARVENYGWLTPAPHMSEYLGHRRYAQTDLIQYQVANKEYDSALSVSLRDIDDSKVGGYGLMFQQMGQKANAFPGILVLKTLALGSGIKCFDGTNFFATTHNVGSDISGVPANFSGGGNLLTYTSQGTSDGVTHRAVFLIHDGIIKPLMYQNRKPARPDSNAGSPQSREAKQVSYWTDLEGACGFGWWWDAIMVNITNTPTIPDVHAILDAVMNQFQGYQMPRALITDPAQYIHQDIQFSAETVTAVVSTKLGRVFAHALGEDRIGVSVAGSTSGITSNIYRGMCDVLISGYMNP